MKQTAIILNFTVLLAALNGLAWAGLDRSVEGAGDAAGIHGVASPAAPSEIRVEVQSVNADVPSMSNDALAPAGIQNVTEEAALRQSQKDAESFYNLSIPIVRSDEKSGAGILKQAAQSLGSIASQRNVSAEQSFTQLGEFWDKIRGKGHAANAPVQAGGQDASSGATIHRSGLSASSQVETETARERAPPDAVGSNASVESNPGGYKSWLPALGLAAYAAVHGFLLFALYPTFGDAGVTGPWLLVRFSTYAYGISNFVGFLFVIPQILELFHDRAKKGSYLTFAIGMAASAFLAFNAAFAHRTFFAYQNLYGALSFLAALAVQWKRRPSGDASWFQAWGRTAWVLAAAGAATYVIGQAIFPAIGALHMGASGVWITDKLQWGASLGFAYLFFPSWLKIERARDAGGVSTLTIVGFLLSTFLIGAWGFHSMVNLLSIDPAINAQPWMVLGGILAAALGSGWLYFHRLSKTDWSRTSGAFGIASSFVGLAGLMVLLAYLSHPLMEYLLVLPGSPDDLAKLNLLTIYLIENAMAVLVSAYTINSIRKYRKAEESVRH